MTVVWIVVGTAILIAAIAAYRDALKEDPRDHFGAGHDRDSGTCVPRGRDNP